MISLREQLKEIKYMDIVQEKNDFVKRIVKRNKIYGYSIGKE